MITQEEAFKYDSVTHQSTTDSKMREAKQVKCQKKTESIWTLQASCGRSPVD